MKITIYGGSFNPPHLGHAEAIRAVQDVVHPDILLVIPAAIPPHKQLEENSPSAAERLTMAMLAFGDIPGVEVSDLELNRAGKSYTADTVRELISCNPDAELSFVVGTDMLCTFEEWHDFRYILEHVSLLALAREPDDLEKIERCAAHLRAQYGARVVVIDTPPLPISSTEVRALLRRRSGAECLAPGVYAHIISQRLYGAKPAFDWLREQAYAMLKPKRIAHVWGCEHEARKLAERWGCNPDTAAEAGILHDITKKFELSDQLLLSEKYGIINDAVETSNTKLLHAKTGAAIAKDLFGISDDVYSAIRWHTTGRADMTLLEKVLYMADYIEPTREFEGVDKLRALAYVNLDQAMILGLEMSLDDLMEGGITPHQTTMDALEWYKHQGETI